MTHHAAVLVGVLLGAVEVVDKRDLLLLGDFTFVEVIFMKIKFTRSREESRAETTMKLVFGIHVEKRKKRPLSSTNCSKCNNKQCS